MVGTLRIRRSVPRKRTRLERYSEPILGISSPGQPCPREVLVAINSDLEELREVDHGVGVESDVSKSSTSPQSVVSGSAVIGVLGNSPLLSGISPNGPGRAVPVVFFHSLLFLEVLGDFAISDPVP